MTSPTDEIVDLTPDLMFLVDRDGRVVHVNRSARTHLDLDVGDAVGDRLSAPEWPPWDQVLEIVDREGRYACDVSLETRAFRLSAHRRTEGGALVQLRRPPAAVTHPRFPLEEGFLTALGRAGIGLWRSDPVTDEVWWSDATFELLNMPPGPVTLESFLEAVTPEGAAEIARNMAAAVAGEGLYEPRYDVITDDGTRRHLYSTGEVVRDASGTPVAYLGVVIDETPLVQARRTCDELRAAAVRNRNLGHLGLLSAGMAHDLNNITTAIMGNAQLLRDSSIEGPDAESVADILTAARHAANLSRNLLSFTRGGRGRESTFDLGELVTEILGILRRTLPKDVELRTELEAARGTVVRADRTQVQQVIMNLVINAIQAMDRGRIGLTLTGTEHDSVVLAVADDGPGIPPENLTRIFDPFYTTREGGSGLGLSMSRELVERFGGRLTAESEPGVGTTFHLELPVATPHAARADAPTAPREIRLDGRSVAVVSDETLVRSVVQRILETAGARVVTFPEPESALRDLPATETPDLLIADDHLPGMKGVDLMKALRRHVPELLGLVLVDFPGSRVEGSPTLSVLTKPFTAQALLESVAGCLG